MSRWRAEYDDGIWRFYRDGMELGLYEKGDVVIDALNNAESRIAELEAVVNKLIWSVEGRVEFMYSKHQREFEDIVAEYKEREAESERFTVHSDIERQDDKSPNDTQTQTIVYGKESEE